jgi:hypothetical protein
LGEENRPHLFEPNANGSLSGINLDGLIGEFCGTGATGIVDDFGHGVSGNVHQSIAGTLHLLRCQVLSFLFKFLISVGFVPFFFLVSAA